jgi:phosphatidylglycerophosphatase A
METYTTYFLNKLATFIGSGFYTGFLPGRATLSTGLFFWYLYALPPTLNFFLIVTFALLVALICCLPSLIDYSKDPKWFVLDELLAFFIGYIVLNLLHITFWWTYLIYFILFRLLDIFKIGIIKKYDTYKNMIGVFGDDLFAMMGSLLITIISFYSCLFVF